MESARAFVMTNTMFSGAAVESFVELIEARDAAIRRECADRAVEWCEKWTDEPWHQVTKYALRAAIEITDVARSESHNAAGL